MANKGQPVARFLDHEEPAVGAAVPAEERRSPQEMYKGVHTQKTRARECKGTTCLLCAWILLKLRTGALQIHQHNLPQENSEAEDIHLLVVPSAILQLRGPVEGRACSTG